MSSVGLPADFPFTHVPEGADEPTELAGRAWSQIARLFISQQRRREAVADELGLQFSDLIALFHIGPDEGVSQRSLAEHWACDPSWVTNRVDRLEQLSYVERRVSATDRRVKEVWLTPAGAKVRERGMAGFARPPSGLEALSIEDLRVLARILDTVEITDPMTIPSLPRVAAAER